MILQNNLLNKLNTLKNASLQKYPDESASIESIMNTLNEPIDNYFNSVKTLGEKLRYIPIKYCMDFYRRNIHYSDDYKYGIQLPTNFPLGYNDLSDLFGHNLNQIYNVDEETFLNAWDFPKSDPMHHEIPVDPPSNSLVDAWINILNNEKDSDSSNIDTLLNFYDDSGNYDDISFFENRGTIIASPTKEEMRNDLFKTKKWLDVIKEYNLNNYIPLEFRDF